MTHSARLIGRCTINFMGIKDISVISVGKGTTRRCITGCIWTGTKLYNATDKSAYFVMQVINMNVPFHILALSVLMWKVCFMDLFFCLRFCLQVVTFLEINYQNQRIENSLKSSRSTFFRKYTTF